jgi:SH3-like domain-containing protein
MFEPICGPHFARPCRHVLRFIALLLAVLTLALPGPAWAQTNNPSGLKLPRFVTTRSSPINVRVGPGVKYEIAWVYLKDGVPVEIVQEFDTWRKIRDVDGQEGWVHQNLLQGPRAGYVTPLVANGTIPLRANRDDNSGLRATLGAGLRVTVKECDGTWCDVTASQQIEGERSASYSGFVHQEELWGVYPDEVFD